MPSTTIKTSLDDYPEWVRRLGRGRAFKAARRGTMRAALRAIPELHKATGNAPPGNPSGVGTGGAVNTGFYKRAWKAEALPDGARLYNASKYGGVIEGGRRPGSRFPPLDAIRDWAQRRLGLSKKEAASAAYPIAKAIARRGLIGRKVLGRVLPLLPKFLAEEVDKELKRELRKDKAGP